MAAPGPLFVGNYTALYECLNVETALARAAEDEEAIIHYGRGRNPARLVWVHFNWSLLDNAQLFDYNAKSRPMSLILRSAIVDELDGTPAANASHTALLSSIASAIEERP